MKYIIFLLLLPSVNLSAAKILTDNTGLSKRFIGIIYENRELKPVYVSAEKIPPTEDGFWGYAQILIKYSVDYETSVPTILLGNNKKFESEITSAVSLFEEDSEGFEWIYNQGWIKTHLLGWVDAKNYPFIFQAQLGWCYVYEIDDGVFSLYVYKDKIWHHLDFPEIWKSPRAFK